MEENRKNKWLKTFEALFTINLVKLLSPVYSLIENDEDDVNKIKSELIQALDEYKDYLIEFVSNAYSKETRIEIDIKEVQEKLNENITKELNLIAFLRTVSNILNIPKGREVNKIEEIFEEYYETLESRIQGSIDNFEDDENIDEFIIDDEDEGEVSVLGRKQYITELKALQVELNKLMEWAVKNNKKIAILFEGRDSSGKGSTIKRFVNYMNPKYYKIVTMGIPKKEELEGDNWFKRYEKHMPSEGQIAFFDRSYYGMALVNPVMNYCAEEQYRYFMENVNKFEEKLTKDDNIILFKFWFSITKEKQIQRFDLRKGSALKYWKYSPNDEKSLPKWELFTKYKEQCFSKTSTLNAPWVIVQSNDKRQSQLNSIRYVLDSIDYDDKDITKIGKIYPEVVYELK